ncbi:hypothetical protein [Thiorhodococcus drewsii]|uniref:hypothetical protein n=1 Tax=Thiorhodococcus drewsii TaxID=210408 RepID=UPI0011129731|nr:hypothetical protein [Thiorhodococcus drewsii]
MPANTAKENQEVNDFFTTLRALQAAGQIKNRYPRIVNISCGALGGESSDFCAVDSDHWGSRSICPDLVLKIPGLNIPDAMSLHVARNTDELTSKMHSLTSTIHVLTWIMLAIAAISLLKFS